MFRPFSGSSRNDEDDGTCGSDKRLRVFVEVEQPTLPWDGLGIRNHTHSYQHVHPYNQPQQHQQYIRLRAQQQQHRPHPTPLSMPMYVPTVTRTLKSNNNNRSFHESLPSSSLLSSSTAGCTGSCAFVCSSGDTPSNRNIWVPNWNRVQDTPPTNTPSRGHVADNMGRRWHDIRPVSSASSSMISVRSNSVSSIGSLHSSSSSSSSIIGFQPSSSQQQPEPLYLPSHSHLYDAQPCLPPRPRPRTSTSTASSASSASVALQLPAYMRGHVNAMPLQAQVKAHKQRVRDATASGKSKSKIKGKSKSQNSRKSTAAQQPEFPFDDPVAARTGAAGVRLDRSCYVNSQMRGIGF
jgi:hypothetical protein